MREIHSLSTEISMCVVVSMLHVCANNVPTAIEKMMELKLFQYNNFFFGSISIRHSAINRASHSQFCFSLFQIHYNVRMMNQFNYKSDALTHKLIAYILSEEDIVRLIERENDQHTIIHGTAVNFYLKLSFKCFPNVNFKIVDSHVRQLRKCFI